MQVLPLRASQTSPGLPLTETQLRIDLAFYFQIQGLLFCFKLPWSMWDLQACGGGEGNLCIQEDSTLFFLSLCSRKDPQTYDPI